MSSMRQRSGSRPSTSVNTASRACTGLAPHAVYRGDKSRESRVSVTTSGTETLGCGESLGSVGAGAAAWHRAAGGGEQAALGECLLAAIDIENRDSGAEQRLIAILDEARDHDDAHVEVFALDALARLAAEAGNLATARDLCTMADRRKDAASHFITDRDRTDAYTVKQLA